MSTTADTTQQDDQAIRTWYSDARNRRQRVADMLRCGARLRTAARSGLHIVASYPSLAEPTFNFPLNTEASRYAHTHLLPPSPEGQVRRLLHAGLSKLLNCDPRIGGITATAGPPPYLRVLRQINERCAAAGEKHTATTAIVLHTTRPILMLFGEASNQPLWVVHHGSRDEVEPEFAVTRTLWAHSPDLIPRPVLCEALEGDEWISVQEGVAGFPWFRYRESRSVRGLADRTEIMLAALESLHEATASQPGWTPVFDLQAELDNRLTQCTELGILPDGIHKLAEQCAPMTLQWPLQHGDFSPNNAILRHNGASIIDFEEFGLTNAPLHDELGLGFAILGNIGEAANRQWLHTCMEPTLERHPVLREHLTGLILHHLLFRLEACCKRHSRAAMMPVLEDRLKRFLDAPLNWVSTSPS